MSFEGKVAFITGAASGIGAATAKLLVSKGARVFGVDRDSETLSATAAEVGGAMVAHVADLSELAQADDAVRAAIKRMGGLDILINNAGVGSLARATDLDPKEWRRVMSIDLDAVFYVTRMALPSLIARRGCIVNTASISGLGGDYGFAVYNSAKAGLIGLTRNLAVDYGAQGVRVNSVCPGPVATPMMGQTPTPLLDAFKKVIPLGRIALAEDVAEGIVFLASNSASYITGHSLVIDGGLTAWTGQPDFLTILAP